MTGYDEAEAKALLYVLGAIDELRAIGIIAIIAGDEPLTTHEERKVYRELKKTGYKPALEEAYAVIKRCVCADKQKEFRRLFRGVIEKGWNEIRRLRAEHKAEEVRDEEIRQRYGYPPGFKPL